MDVLGSIWNVLTTENQVLTKIIIFPTIFIEVWLVFRIFTTILKFDYTKKQEIIYIFSISIVSKLTELFIPEPFNIFINYIIIFIVIKFVFKENIIKTILAIIIPILTFALITTLIFNPILKLFRISSDILNNIPIYKVIYLFTLYYLAFLFTYLLQHINLHFTLIENLNKSSKRIIILNLCLGIITLSVQAILTYYYINILPIFITILNFILLLSYFIISFYSLAKTMKLQITTQNLESAENYNATLSYLYDNVRAFHHDFDNMLFIIGGFIDHNDIEGLKKYYKNLEKDGERVNNIALLNPKIINNSGIYNLLMAKYKKAHDVNVDIKLEFFFDFNRLNMPIYEFSRILGILIDNSIEAAQDTNEKQVHILFRDSSINHTQIVSIENTYINKDVNKTKIFEKGVTGKENHTGMGLWEVNQILKRNNNVKLVTETNKKLFKQTLEIYY